MTDASWWRGAVIYQVYPRSFLDTNGDGIGDLPGIEQKLDYIAGLGVDAIWISPFFRSPMADFGYDIEDYRDVDPIFGTLEDFDRLLAKAHALHLKVMIDQVLSHSSAEHPWFKESRQSRHSGRADWYVWADPKEDGTAPNNWLSLFGGSAWQWEPRREQYYLHNFLASQPDLNFHHPQVRQAALENLRFWLERGVDGFRLDAINFCFHDKLLRDNPPRPGAERLRHGVRPDNPYAYQYHRFNNTRPENLAFLAEIRRLMEQYPNAATLGEISSDDSLVTMAEYTSGERLHMSYTFELLSQECSADYLRDTAATVERIMAHGWPCWAISNHDCVRVRTRWADADAPDRVAGLFTALAATLRGSVCVYQGEELALPEADVPFAALQDPYGIAFWPNYKGRDGCRTPMPWEPSEHGAFTRGTPWLPVDREHLRLSVADQERDPHSPLNSFRRFVRWRKAHPALLRGDIRFLELPAPLLGVVRSDENESILALFNLGGEERSVSVPAVGACELSGHGLISGRLQDGAITLPAYAAFFATAEPQDTFARAGAGVRQIA